MLYWFKRFMWKVRVKRCWRQSRGDIGEFYGCIGYYIALGLLPPNILRRKRLLQEIRVKVYEKE